MPAIADFTSVNTATFGDWQRDYLYKILVLDEPLAPDFAAKKGAMNKEFLDAYCDAVPVPNSKQGIIRRMWAGQWYNGSGRLDSANTVALQVRFDEETLAHQYFSAWSELAGKDVSAASVPKNLYIGNIALLLYKTDKTSVGEGYKLVNAWVSEVSDLGLDKTKDGYLTFTVTIAYDKREPYSA